MRRLAIPVFTALLFTAMPGLAQVGAPAAMDSVHRFAGLEWGSAHEAVLDRLHVVGAVPVDANKLECSRSDGDCEQAFSLTIGERAFTLTTHLTGHPRRLHSVWLTPEGLVFDSAQEAVAARSQIVSMLRERYGTPALTAATTNEHGWTHHYLYWGEDCRQPASSCVILYYNEHATKDGLLRMNVRYISPETPQGLRRAFLPAPVETKLGPTVGNPF